MYTYPTPSFLFSWLNTAVTTRPPATARPPGRLIFIDGPTGVGKGYFTDGLCRQLTSLHPTCTFKTVRLTDLTVLADPSTQSEDRKYHTYLTGDAQVETLHLHHLRALIALRQFTRQYDYVLVDRSYLSFLCYNAWEDSKCAQRESLMKEYAKYFDVILRCVNTTLVHLEVEGDAEQAVQILLDRVQSRRDGKPVSVDWLRQLHGNYRQLEHLIRNIFDGVVNTTSDRYADFANTLIGR